MHHICVDFWHCFLNRDVPYCKHGTHSPHRTSLCVCQTQRQAVLSVDPLWKASLRIVILIWMRSCFAFFFNVWVYHHWSPDLFVCIIILPPLACVQYNRAVCMLYIKQHPAWRWPVMLQMLQMCTDGWTGGSGLHCTCAVQLGVVRTSMEQTNSVLLMLLV